MEDLIRGCVDLREGGMGWFVFDFSVVPLYTPKVVGVGQQ